jgi:hypothetical protein
MTSEPPVRRSTRLSAKVNSTRSRRISTNPPLIISSDNEDDEVVVSLGHKEKRMTSTRPRRLVTKPPPIIPSESEVEDEDDERVYLIPKQKLLTRPRRLVNKRPSIISSVSDVDNDDEVVFLEPEPPVLIDLTESPAPVLLDLTGPTIKSIDLNPVIVLSQMPVNPQARERSTDSEIEKTLCKEPLRTPQKTKSRSTGGDKFVTPPKQRKIDSENDENVPRDLPRHSHRSAREALLGGF